MSGRYSCHNIQLLYRKRTRSKSPTSVSKEATKAFESPRSCANRSASVKRFLTNTHPASTHASHSRCSSGWLMELPFLEASSFCFLEEITFKRFTWSLSFCLIVNATATASATLLANPSFNALAMAFCASRPVKVACVEPRDINVLRTNLNATPSALRSRSVSVSMRSAREELRYTSTVSRAVTDALSITRALSFALRSCSSAYAANAAASRSASRAAARSC